MHGKIRYSRRFKEQYYNIIILCEEFFIFNCCIQLLYHVQCILNFWVKRVPLLLSFMNDYLLNLFSQNSRLICNILCIDKTRFTQDDINHDFHNVHIWKEKNLHAA